MHWWGWYLLGAVTLGAAIFQPKIRKYCVQGLVWLIEKIHELLQKWES
jgi:hypothetical protein